MESTDEPQAPAVLRLQSWGTRHQFYLKATILEVVENQVRENDPPETRQTLKRLLAVGYTQQRAVELIGSAVVEEIWQVLQERKPFDRARYKTLLDKLG